MQMLYLNNVVVFLESHLNALHACLQGKEKMCDVTINSSAPDISNPYANMHGLKQHKQVCECTLFP